MIKLEKSRLEVLKDEFEKEYFNKIKTFLLEEIKKWKTIYPKWWDIFNALNSTPFEKIKVVIIWQDPYHGYWQAHGLCFSVPDWTKQPPSLKNIFKEIESDLWIKMSNNWNLENWAKQWVLLLNSVLTVEKEKAWSHSNIWWQQFTDKIIMEISKRLEWVIFLLWGSYAHSKDILININKHYILKTVHPSPLSAYRWFFGSKHFSKTNEILKKLGKKEINWEI